MNSLLKGRFTCMSTSSASITWDSSIFNWYGVMTFRSRPWTWCLIVLVTRSSTARWWYLQRWSFLRWRSVEWWYRFFYSPSIDGHVPHTNLTLKLVRVPLTVHQVAKKSSSRIILLDRRKTLRDFGALDFTECFLLDLRLSSIASCFQDSRDCALGLCLAVWKLSDLRSSGLHTLVGCGCIWIELEVLRVCPWE